MKDTFSPSRRDFLKTTGISVAAGLTAAQYKAFAAEEGANDKINIGVIGVGGRGSSLLDWVIK
nr:twin-arginine translocation signal domain-containing protein [bacterium]